MPGEIPGLSDFGSDDWYEPFRIFVRALEDESELTLIGRLMTRSDILMHLEARLRIEDVVQNAIPRSNRKKSVARS